jgi:hypothetical protein
MQVLSTLAAAYHDLLQLHLRQPKVSIGGSLMRVERGGVACWVSRQRFGAAVREQYVGVDNEETRGRIEAATREQDALKSWSKNCSDLVRILRSGHALAPDPTTGRVLAALAGTGFFGGGGVLAGTHAFRMYPILLGQQPPLDSPNTDDVDFAAPRGLRLIGATGASVVDQIERAGVGMTPVYDPTTGKPLKWLADGKVEVEFLAPVGADEALVSVHDGLGLQVQTLRYIEFLLRDPIQTVALFRSGVLISVPRPARFALHKLIVSEIRTGSFQSKSVKDRQQAAWLIESLAQDQPFELYSAWTDAGRHGAKWQKLILRAMAKIPQAREIFDAALQEFGDEPDTSEQP